MINRALSILGHVTIHGKTALYKMVHHGTMANSHHRAIQLGVRVCLITIENVYMGEF